MKSGLVTAGTPSDTGGKRCVCMTASRHVMVDFILGVRNPSRLLIRETALSYSFGGSGVVSLTLGGDATNCSRSASNGGEASSGSDRSDSHSGGQ